MNRRLNLNMNDTQSHDVLYYDIARLDSTSDM